MSAPCPPCGGIITLKTASVLPAVLVIPIDYEKCATKLNIGSIPTQREIKYLFYEKS